MLAVIYHPEAEAEIIEAALFYNERVPRLGVDFLDEIDQGIAAILDQPTLWRAVEEDIRRYLIKRFPYAIMYRIELNNIRVLAVAHHSRSPGYWKHRKEN